MSRLNVTAAMLAIVTLVMVAGCTSSGPETAVRATEEGERLFMQYCVGCHPGGRNIKFPQKSLGRMVLKANGISTVDDIVAKMRKPDEGMPRFDRQRVPDAAARAIAGYILATFP